MKFTILALSLLALNFCLIQAGPVEIQNWEQFKQVFQKQYSSVEEEAERKAIFETNLKFVVENQGQNGVSLGLNEFSDQTDEEFFAKNFDILDEQEESHFFDSIQTEEDFEYAALPASWDWRDHAQFNAVENQGRCGSCWAFATVLAVEAQFSIKQKRLLHLSKQELVDCSLKSYDSHYINQGCRLGYTSEAMKYMKEHGIHEELVYPYRAVNETCHLTKITSDHFPYKITDYRRLAYNGSDADMLNILYSNGPITVNINDHDVIFKHYKSGIIRDLMPHIKQTTHSVTLIGYGTEGGVDYWLMRNSWGANWGDHGHFKIERHHNLMGINNHPIYPIVNAVIN